MSASPRERLLRSRHSENRAFFVSLAARGNLLLRPRLSAEEALILATESDPPSDEDYVLRPVGTRHVPTEYGYAIAPASEGFGFFRIPSGQGAPTVASRIPQHYPTVLFDDFLEDIAHFPELRPWRDQAVAIASQLSRPCRPMAEAHQLGARYPEFLQLQDNPGLQLMFTLWTQRQAIADSTTLCALLRLPRQQLLEIMCQRPPAAGALSLLERLRTPGIATAAWPRGGSWDPSSFIPVTWDMLLDRALSGFESLLGSEAMVQLAKRAPAIGSLHLASLPAADYAGVTAVCPAFAEEWLSLPVIEAAHGTGDFRPLTLELEAVLQLCRDAIDLGVHAQIEGIGRALKQCRQPDQIQRLHDRWLEHSLQVPLSLVDGTLPPPHLDGTTEIVPIGSVRALHALAAQQHNCVGSYASRILAREIDVYAVEVDGERATLTIALLDRFSSPIQPRVEDLRGACNQGASRRVEMTVKRWLRAAVAGA